MASKATARYIAPVSRYGIPRRRASREATVDLPAPAGPSMAMISLEGVVFGGLVVKIEVL
jgi:hypothetical protein